MADRLTVIPSPDSLLGRAGEKLGPSDWFEVTQQRIDAFAAATEDHQWIHVDPERAAVESPWKTTIAHGYLTLSLVPHLLDRILRVEACSRAVNTGLDRLRLATPVPAGAHLRLLAEIKDARRLPGEGVRLALTLRMEVQGEAKPALLATANYVYFP